jgi:polysaccharide chain length determinant protein (PEP-CTERM system associated)
VTQLLDQALNHVRDIWRSRWWGMLVTWGVSLLGWAVVLAWPNVYEARASVYVNTTSALQPVLRGLTVESDLMSQLELVRQLVLSREHLSVVAEETQLFAVAMTDEERNLVVTDLRDNIDIAGGRTARDRLYTITYRNGDRERALKVVSAIVKSFVEGTIGTKLVVTDSAERFLNDQKLAYEQRLVEAENRLADFRRQHMGFLPGDRLDYFNRLQQEVDLRATAQRNLAQAQAERDQIQRQLDGESPVSAIPGVGDIGDSGSRENSTRNPLERRIQEAEIELRQARLRWTDRHPEVIALQQQVAQLRDERTRYLNALGVDAGGDSPISVENNPVYQSLRLALNEVDLRIFQLTAEIATRSESTEELERLADTVPKVEAEYQQLNRDYNVINGQYQEVVKRLETARLSGEAEQSEEVDFRTIEPAAADSRPVAPRRLLLLPAVFVVAVGLGIWVALMRSQLNGTLYTSADIQRAASVPVLGLVDNTMPARNRLRKRLRGVGFATVMLVLVGMLGVVVAIEFFEVDWRGSLRGGLS